MRLVATSYDVRPPRITGRFSESGANGPRCSRVTFEDEAHLRSYVKQTIVQTRSLGKDYAPPG